MVYKLLPRLGGDIQRIYLAGQSMGGNGAWMFAAQQPRFFAATVIVCGYAQQQEADAGAMRVARSPVAVYHSADDSVIPVAAADLMVDSLRRAQASRSSGKAFFSFGDVARRPHAGCIPGVHGCMVRYVRYETAPGPPMPEYEHLIGHGSYELAFRDADLYSWLLEQRCEKCGRNGGGMGEASGGDDVVAPAPWRPLDSSSDHRL